MTRRVNKKVQNYIAQQRIDRLFFYAKQQAKSGNISFAQHAVRIARRIAMKTNFRLPKEYKLQLCKHCYHYLVPAVTCRVRFRKGKKTITCYHCQKQMRYPYE